MSLEQFSTVLTLGVLAILIYVTYVVAMMLLFPKKEGKLTHLSYEQILVSIGLVAAISTMCVLIYQFIYNLEVCVLCWWQRIFMFPIEVIIFVALWFGQRYAHVTVAVLAFIGTLFAGYHYWNHFQNLVLGKKVVLPCGEIGLVPSCSEFSFTIFGFMTIPGMALAAFLSILGLCFVAAKQMPKN